MVLIFNPCEESFPVFWNRLKLVGEDAGDFLHRLTTVNVSGLKPGEGSLGCFLTPQGKFRAYFSLWQEGSQEYIFELEGGDENHWSSELLSTIHAFTFNEKMRLIEESEETFKECCFWIFFDSLGSLGSSPSSHSSTFLEPLKPLTWSSLKPYQTIFLRDRVNSGIRLYHHGSEDYGRPWITAWGKKEALLDWIQKSFSNASFTSLDQIEQWRVASLRPRIDHEITEKALPLELGLHHAIASQKGCYPGQEVIEKIIALGSPSRRLVRIQGEGFVPEIGQGVFWCEELTSGINEIGHITTATRFFSESPQKSSQGNSFQVLAILKKTYAKEGMQILIGPLKVLGVITHVSGLKTESM